MSEENLIISAKELLKLNLIIPEYQRAYTWNNKNISKMVEDFEEFLKSEYKEDTYYLGTILLHKDDVKYNIIDGQQRITTLLLMLKIIKNTNFKDIIYDNPKSQYRIVENYKVLEELSEDKINIINDTFEKIRFTVIKTDNIDDAFTFFDTQNSRGIQPSVLVLLKSFNLRAISKDKFELQKECALAWEESEKNKHISLSEESEKLEWLIKIFFYRVRNWKSNTNADFGSYDDFRDSFTKELRRDLSKDIYKKYPNYANQIVISDNTESILKPRNSDWFEFSIRQPIYQGEGFFKFVEYYSKLLDELMDITIHNKKKFQDLARVHKVGSRFIASFLIMATLTYYERFGKAKLIAFIKKLDSLLADIRLKQGRILKQTMDIQFIRCKNEHINQNILDFICGAYDSEEVDYWMNNINNFKYNTDSGVQGRFSKKHEELWKKNNEEL